MFLKQISEAVDAQTQVLPPSQKLFSIWGTCELWYWRPFVTNLGHKIYQKCDFVAGTMTVIWSHLMLHWAWYKEKLNVTVENDKHNVHICTSDQSVSTTSKSSELGEKTSSENWVISVTTELMETFAPFLLLLRSSRISRDL